MMLAQTFLTAQDLRITEIERMALIQFLGMVEREELELFSSTTKISSHNGILMKEFIFNPSNKANECCGTVACICGWAHILSDGKAFPEVNDIVRGHGFGISPFAARLTHEAQKLFAIDYSLPLQATQSSHIAEAVRNYLTKGDPDWNGVLKN